MDKQLIIDTEKCTGCSLCEMICALNKTGLCHPSLARIKVWREEKQGQYIPLVCQHCCQPLCAEACLMNAISKDRDTGITIRNLQACIACRACQAACPFEGSRYDYLQEVVVNCDLCGGDPQCVKYCPFGALQYVRLQDSLNSWRRQEAERRVVNDSGR